RPVAGRTIRPLIDVTRNEIEAYLQSRNQSWRNDASNLDTAYVRNEIRHVVILELAARFNPQWVKPLTITADIIENEDALMGSLTKECLDQNGINQEDGFVLAGKTLESAPVALQRRVVRAALQKAGSNLHDVAFEHVEAVRGIVARGK